MRRLIPLLLLGLLAGCATTPPTAVHQPMSVRPQARQDSFAPNGSIFQAGSSRPLFEDRRARFMGDTLTINIVENTAASTKSNSKTERDGSVEASVTNMAGVPGKSFLGLGVTASNVNNFSGKGESVANNVFTGTITVTVIEVLANGNLLVSGEKQLAIGQGQEFIRLSGVVNPNFVNSANTIDSTKVADVRVEYRSSGYIAESQVMGWLARFFLTVLPF